MLSTSNVWKLFGVYSTRVKGWLLSTSCAFTLAMFLIWLPGTAKNVTQSTYWKMWWSQFFSNVHDVIQKLLQLAKRCKSVRVRSCYIRFENRFGSHKKKIKTAIIIILSYRKRKMACSLALFWIDPTIFETVQRTACFICPLKEIGNHLLIVENSYQHLMHLAIPNRRSSAGCWPKL